MKKIIYEIVMKRIITELEKDTISWQRPWYNSEKLQNLKTNRECVRKHTPIPKCESIILKYTQNSGPLLKHDGYAAFYDVVKDIITIPKPEVFKSVENYYTVLFHEIIHSTGHPSRLNRAMGADFGTEFYFTEELIAEIGAAFLTVHTKIDSDSFNENTVAYIAGWKKTLGSNLEAVIGAAGRAKKAVNYILRVTQVNVKKIK